MRRIEKDEPGIPIAEVYALAGISEGGICWSCQNLLSPSVLPIHLDGDTLLPVCPECWGQLTVAERLGFAIQFRVCGASPLPHAE